MTDWSEGYMTEMEYVYTYHSHLNPLHMNLAMLSAGYLPRAVTTACELGFGQGISLNMHSASSSASWYGTDFHPSHAAFAMGLAKASGAHCRLFDQSFMEFCSRPDLPDFDFIVLHGIWSWISDANRTAIVDFVRSKLKPGGVLSISYNTLHGWSSMLPMRDLLTEHSRRMSAPSLDMASRIDVALNFIDGLMTVIPNYSASNPQSVAGLAKMKSADRSYVAGEYFSHDWNPMPFSDVAHTLSAAKLEFACAATYGDHVDAIRLTQPQQALLQTIADPHFRETVRDFCLEQPFRRDYWIKGGEKLTPHERIEALYAQRVVLVCPAENVRLLTAMTNGEPPINAVEGKRLLNALADHKPHSLSDLMRHIGHGGMTFDRVLNFVLIMADQGYLQSAQNDGAISNAIGTGAALRLNMALVQKASVGRSVRYLASPVTGGGVPVARYYQLFLLARAEGFSSPTEWAQIAWRYLDAQGEHVDREAWGDRELGDVLSDLVRQAQATGHKDPQFWAQTILEFLQENGCEPFESKSVPLSVEDQISELMTRAKIFADRHLPMLIALGVV